MKITAKFRHENLAKLLCLSIAAVLHCGNAAIYDEALTTYYRVVRPGLNEWYPLNGNLVSRIGSVTGTATAAYSAGTNRAGDSNKAVCTTTSRFDFSPMTFGAAPFTVSAWVKFNVLTAGPNSLLQRGVQMTGYRGFIIQQNDTVSIPASLGDGSFSTNFVGAPATAGVWYYLALTYGNNVGTLYVGQYGGALNQYSPSFGNGNYIQYTTTDFQVFVSAVNGCVDDLLHYNRALSVDEVRQNFLSLE
ncbi:MAG: hypothetical protein OHK0011_13430 [Turneriella sp.]